MDVEVLPELKTAMDKASGFYACVADSGNATMKHKAALSKEIYKFCNIVLADPSRVDPVKVAKTAAGLAKEFKAVKVTKTDIEDAYKKCMKKFVDGVQTNEKLLVTMLEEMHDSIMASLKETPSGYSFEMHMGVRRPAAATLAKRRKPAAATLAKRKPAAAKRKLAA